MNRNAKNISSSLRPQIEIVKGYIRSSERPFDGDGYVFQKAVSELRKSGWVIKFIRAKDHYLSQGFIEKVAA